MIYFFLSPRNFVRGIFSFILGQRDRESDASLLTALGFSFTDDENSTNRSLRSASPIWRCRFFRGEHSANPRNDGRGIEIISLDRLLGVGETLWKARRCVLHCRLYSTILTT